MIAFGIAYLVASGYIALIGLVFFLVLRGFADDERLRSVLMSLGILCLAIFVVMKGSGWLRDRNQRNDVENHALAFGKFCADGPVSPTVKRTVPVEGVAVLEFMNTAKPETSRLRSAGQLAGELKGMLICKTRSSLKVTDGLQDTGRELCSGAAGGADVPLSAANYQLTFMKVAEQTFPEGSTSNGAMRMTKVAVQVRSNTEVLGEDVIYVAQQAPGAYWERCLYPAQRLAELLTGVFQLLEVKGRS